MLESILGHQVVPETKEGIDRIQHNNVTTIKLGTLHPSTTQAQFRNSEGIAIFLLCGIFPIFTVLSTKAVLMLGVACLYEDLMHGILISYLFSFQPERV